MNAHLDFYLSARDSWLQSFQLMAAANEKVLMPEKWPAKVSITTEPGVPQLSLTFQSSFEEHPVEEWVNNVMIATFGVFSMAAVSALDNQFKADRLIDPELSRRSLRCIWYMIRCAFAHPTAGIPTWNCKGDYAKPFTLRDSFTLDGLTLNNIPFSIDQLGGWHHVYELLRQTNEILGIEQNPKK